MKSDAPQLTGLPASIDRDSEHPAASLTVVFECFCCALLSDNNWKTIGTSAIVSLGALRLPGQCFSRRNGGNTMTIVYCAAQVYRFHLALIIRFFLRGFSDDTHIIQRSTVGTN